MSRRRTVHKILECAAHPETVNCVAIGPQSDQVLATGADDCKVNLWRFGSPQCVMSLSGHQKPVECLTFDPSEDTVLAGSQSGSIKVFELAKAKVSRTLSGHRSNCTAVQVHPFNNIVASGSLDTNVKLWDVRKRHEFITFKGHSKVINCLRFSPDGRWVASGAGDGAVKIWDLTAGKLMHTFSSHNGPVGALAFNPNEFLLASGSDDRTVKLWDLERFVLHSTAPFDTQKIRQLQFTPDGGAVLSATVDSLRVIHVGERTSVVANMDAPWGYVHALHCCSNWKVLAASSQQGFVSEWGVDLKRVAPSVVNDDPSRPTTAQRRPRSQGRSRSPLDGGSGSSARTRAASPSPPPPAFRRRDGDSPRGAAPSLPLRPESSGSAGTGTPSPRGYSRGGVRTGGGLARAAAANRAAAHSPLGDGGGGGSRASGGGGGAGSDATPSPARPPMHPARARVTPVKVPAASAAGPTDSIVKARAEFGTLLKTKGEASHTDVDTLAAEMAKELSLPAHRYPSASPIDVPASHHSPPPQHRSPPRASPAQRSSPAAVDAGSGAGAAGGAGGKKFMDVAELSLGLSETTLLELAQQLKQTKEDGDDGDGAAQPTVHRTPRTARAATRASPPSGGIASRPRPKSGRRRGVDSSAAAEVGHRAVTNALSGAPSHPHRSPAAHASPASAGAGAGSGAPYVSPRLDAAAVEKARVSRANRIKAAVQKRSLHRRASVPRGQGAGRGPGAGGSALDTSLIPAERAVPVGLDVHDFLPPEAANRAPMTGSEVYEAVTADHDSFLAVLRRRASAVHVLVTTWSSGNIKAALAHLERCKDTSVAADFLSSVNLLHAAIKLEHCAKLLPHVNKLLASKFGDYALVGLKALRVLFLSFSPVVANLMSQQARMRPGGIDVSHEDRARRVLSAHTEFRSAHTRVAVLTRRAGVLGQTAADMMDLLNTHFGSSAQD